MTFDVNAWLAKRLQAAGITCPACEEPLSPDEVKRQQAQSTVYITWRQLGIEPRYASGELYAVCYTMEMSIWIPRAGTKEQTAAWRQLRHALMFPSMCSAIWRSMSPASHTHRRRKASGWTR